MENVQRKIGRLDLSSIHIDLGSVELTTCPTPEGLEFEALVTDPQLDIAGSFYLEGIKQAGVFIEVKVGQRIFCIHEKDVRLLYRVSNFSLKRNFFVSDETRVVEPNPETIGLEKNLQQQQWFTKDQVKPISPIKGEESKSENSEASTKGVETHGKTVEWSTVVEEDDEDLYGFNTGFSSDRVLAKKQTTGARFLSLDFVQNLSALGQSRIGCDKIFGLHPDLRKRNFYLFDYVALFVDFMDLYEIRGDFRIPLIQAHLRVLNQIEGTQQRFSPLQAESNKGWSSNVKFLCQILPGEYQISFLRVTLFYSVWKVAKLGHIQKSDMNEETRSFLLGDKSSHDDCLRVTRLNLNALANNQRVLIDQNYIPMLSDVDEED